MAISRADFSFSSEYVEHVLRMILEDERQILERTPILSRVINFDVKSAAKCEPIVSAIAEFNAIFAEHYNYVVNFTRQSAQLNVALSFVCDDRISYGIELGNKNLNRIEVERTFSSLMDKIEKLYSCYAELQSLRDISFKVLVTQAEKIRELTRQLPRSKTVQEREFKNACAGWREILKLMISSTKSYQPGHAKRRKKQDVLLLDIRKEEKKIKADFPAVEKKMTRQENKLAKRQLEAERKQANLQQKADRKSGIYRRSSSSAIVFSQPNPAALPATEVRVVSSSYPVSTGTVSFFPVKPVVVPAPAASSSGSSSYYAPKGTISFFQLNPAAMAEVDSSANGVYSPDSVMPYYPMGRTS